MTIPSRNQLHRPILKMAGEADIDISYQQLLDIVAKQFSLTDEDLAEKLASGPGRARKTVEWSVQNLINAGFLSKTARGRQEITTEGREYLENGPEEITQSELVRIVNEKRTASESAEYADEHVETAAGQSTGQLGTTVGVPTVLTLPAEEDSTPEEMMELADLQIQAKLSGELLHNAKQISPEGFERLTLDLLRQMGYGEPEHTGRSGDEGIDGVLRLDALGLERVYVQAKRLNTGSVGGPDMQKFAGSMIEHGATKGVFITTATFNINARRTATNVSNRNETIRLVDGNDLAQLMIRHGVGVVTEYTYEIKKLDENYFANEA